MLFLSFDYSGLLKKCVSRAVYLRSAFRVRLANERGTLAGHLTYAQQRVLEIGISIASGADATLLDEPTAGMNRSESAAMVALIRRVTQSKTQLMIEQDMEVVVPKLYRDVSNK